MSISDCGDYTKLFIMQKSLSLISLLAVFFALAYGQYGFPAEHGFIAVFSPTANESYTVGQNMSIYFDRATGANNTGATGLDIVLTNSSFGFSIINITSFNSSLGSQCPTPINAGGPCYNTTVIWSINPNITSGQYNLSFVEFYINNDQNRTVVWEVPVILTSASIANSSPSGSNSTNNGTANSPSSSAASSASSAGSVFLLALLIVVSSFTLI